MSARVVAAGVAALLALGAGAATGPRHMSRPGPASPRELSVAEASDLLGSPQLRLIRAISTQHPDHDGAHGPDEHFGAEVLNIAPDGSLVVGNGGYLQTPTGAVPIAGFVELVAADGTTATLAEPPNDPPLRPSTAVSDEDNVVWSETAADEFNSGVWRILAFNRHTGSTTVIAGNADFGLGDGYGAEPRLAGGRVYWGISRVDPAKPDGGRDDLYSRDVAGIGPIVIAVEDIRGVSATGALLCYAQDEGPHNPTYTLAIHRRQLLTGADEVVSRVALGSSDDFGGPACVGGSVVWGVGRHAGETRLDSQLVVLDDSRRTVITGDGYFWPPTMTPALVAWNGAGSDGQMWVFDRARSNVSTLGTAYGGATVRATDRYVAWRTETEWQVGELTAP